MRDPISRFWANVDASNGPDACWNYTGGQNGFGYGRHKFAGKSYGAHRLAWELANGKIIPKGEGYHGTCVLHTCDNRLCCNPKHLELGTHAENMSDMTRKQRSYRPVREINKSTKISQLQIAALKAFTWCDIFTQKELAGSFGVSKTLIWNILGRRNTT